MRLGRLNKNKNEKYKKPRVEIYIETENSTIIKLDDVD
jgi:hypothetical protein